MARRYPVLEASFTEAIGLVGQVATRVLDDPALPKVVSLLGELKAVELARAQGQPSILESPEQGIGLSRAVKPLQIVIAVRKKPWLVPALAFGVLAVPFLLGVSVGRR